MRYVINSAELYTRLQNLDKVILVKNSIPILSCVLFEISDNTLKMRATDKEITLISSMQLIESSGDSSFAINAKRILEILKSIPEQPVTLDVNTTTLQIDLSYQNGHMVFQGENADEFPLIKENEGHTATIPVAADALSKGLANAIVAAANDDARIAMQGIFIDITPEEFAIVASDGRKLVRSLISCNTNGVSTSFILPQKPVAIIRSVLDKASSEVNISTFAEGNATFEMNDYTMHCRLVTETYPNYKKVIPQNNDRIATIDRNSLSNALRRVMVIADRSTSLVKLQFEADKLTITAENNNYAQAAEEHILCQYEGMPIKIGFQGNFLQDLLGRVNSEEIVIKLSDPSRAGLVLPSEQEPDINILMLLMPLLITN